MEEDKDPIVEVLYIIFLIFALTMLIGMCSSCVTKREVVEKPVLVEKVSHDTVTRIESVEVVDSVWIVDTIIKGCNGTERSVHNVYHSRSRDKSSEKRDVSKKNEQEPVYITVTKEKKVRDLREMGVMVGIGVLLGVLGVLGILRYVRRRKPS